MPTPLFTDLAELAADQYGLVTVADARAVGYADRTVAQMATRGQLERVSRGVYRVPFLPGGELGPYMEAALWPVGVQGVLSHETALDLWDVSDVNPAKIHITVPRDHRPQRAVPAAYVVHRQDLADSDTTTIEGVPLVTLERAVRDCAAGHLGADLLRQAVRAGRGRGLLTRRQAADLLRDLALGRYAEDR
jgi:predicted transcriptional regulator of viral defense system